MIELINKTWFYIRLVWKHEVKKAIKGITNLLKELEIDFNQIDNTGYTKMLWYKGTVGKRDFID